MKDHGVVNDICELAERNGAAVPTSSDTCSVPTVQ